MKFTFWGVRGSFPVARDHARKLGGNTACIHVEAEGQELIIDAGTGIRRLGQQLAERGPIGGPLHLLVSHTHWDHIQGFPYFAPAYSPQFQLRVFSVQRAHTTLRQLLAHQQEAEFFPVPLDTMGSSLQFFELQDAQPLELGPFRVTPLRLNHPGISTGFRIEVGGAVLSYVCDVAPSRDLLMAEQLSWDLNPEGALSRLYDNQVALADGAQAVIYDTFFRPSDYQDRKHWGHSTIEDGLAVCREARASNMFLFHHNPEYDDDELIDRMEALQPDSSVRLWPGCEGRSYQIAGDGVELCK